MNKKAFLMYFLSIVLLFSSFAASTATVGYELWIQRFNYLDPNPYCSVYFATVNGQHFSDSDPAPDHAPSEMTISMFEDFDTPQFFVAVRNNLQKATGYRVKLSFEKFTRTDNEPFDAGYFVACMCKYKTVTFKVDGDGDGYGDYDARYYVNQSQDPASFDLTNKNNYSQSNSRNWTKCTGVINGSKSMDWEVEATNQGPDVIKTWYYAICLVFDGVVPGMNSDNPYSYSDGYPAGVTFRSQVRLELITP